MVDGPLVLHQHLHHHVEALFNGADGRVDLDEAVHPLPQNFLHQSRQVLKVVVKRVAVDAAFLHDIFYRNLAQRTLPQLPEEGLFNGFPGKIRHVRRPFP